MHMVPQARHIAIQIFTGLSTEFVDGTPWQRAELMQPAGGEGARHPQCPAQDVLGWVAAASEQ
jgi:hypothetical protein